MSEILFFRLLGIVEFLSRVFKDGEVVRIFGEWGKGILRSGVEVRRL